MLKSKQVPLEFQTKQKKFKKMYKIKPKSSVYSISTKVRGYYFINKSVIDIKTKQLTSMLKIIKPKMKNFSKKSRLRFFPAVDKILTRKPKDIRMGRGKGAPSERVASLKNGSSMFKLRGLRSKNAKSIYTECSLKSAVKNNQINTLEW